MFLVQVCQTAGLVPDHIWAGAGLWQRLRHAHHVHHVWRCASGIILMAILIGSIITTIEAGENDGLVVYIFMQEYRDVYLRI